ncbi:MAG: winged helix-turn-helix domain-containing protein [Nitrosarchaeum sp.]
MVEDALIELVKIMGEDIRQIRKDMARMARDSYRQDLEKVANTPARQEIWRLCDGNISNEEIAKKIGVTSRTVQYFVLDAEKKGLITTPRRGYPKRTDSFDEIPVEWKTYKKSEEQVTLEPGGNSNE